MKKKKRAHPGDFDARGKKTRISSKNLFQRDSTFRIALSPDGYGNGIKCYSKQFYGLYFSL